MTNPVEWRLLQTSTEAVTSICTERHSGPSTTTMLSKPNPCDAGACITNQVRVVNSPQSFFWYGISSRSAATMVLDGHGNPQMFNNPGGWPPGGVIAAYMPFTGETLQPSWQTRFHDGLLHDCDIGQACRSKNRWSQLEVSIANKWETYLL